MHGSSSDLAKLPERVAYDHAAQLGCTWPEQYGPRLILLACTGLMALYVGLLGRSPGMVGR